MPAGEKLNDAQLIVRSLEGDDDAFDCLCNRHKTRLFSYAFNRVRNHEDAKDIVQETFIEIWQNLWRFKDSQKFPNWMFRIASQIIARKSREREKQVKYMSLARHVNETETEVFDVAAVLVHRHNEQRQELDDLRDRLARAIEQLPDSERQPLLLRLSGMSHKEIAQELGLSEAVVNNRLARGRKRLKSLVHKLTE